MSSIAVQLSAQTRAEVLLCELRAQGGGFMKKNLGLKFIWKIRLHLLAEGNKLLAEGNKLYAEGNKLWAEAVIEVYGNVVIEWKNGKDCKVEGITYKG